MKTCCFFGHKEVIKDKIVYDFVIKKIELLILDGFDTFLFGGYGGFDELCFSATKVLKKTYSNIKTIYVQAYYKPHDDGIKILQNKYDEIIYPPIEDKPLRFAITYRNQYMIDMSDYGIFFVYRSYGGAYQAFQYAKRRKKDFAIVPSVL